MLIIGLSLLKLNAQVTIGSLIKPNSGALLDLKMEEGEGINANKGLGLPRVSLKNIRTESDLGKTMGATDGNTLDHLEHTGLIVYNIAKNEESEATRYCPGVHVWNGEEWKPLKPYPEVTVEKGNQLSYKRSYEYLDPNNPANWPADKETARANGYYALGRSTNNGTEDIADRRSGESATNYYTVSRFYVGYKIMERQYERVTNLSCNPDNPDPSSIIVDTQDPIREVEKVFDDGIWMTQNLRTLRMPDGTAITPMGSGVDPTNGRIPQYYYPNNSSTYAANYGVLYNYSAAIGLGAKNTTPANPSTFPDQTQEQGGSTKEDVIYQGICPAGWNLPADQEWTDLANGIVGNPTTFAQTLDGTASKVDYDFMWNPSNTTTAGITEGGYLGQAMKSQNKISSSHSATNGKSLLGDQGGFDAHMAGSGSKTSGQSSYTYDFGKTVYFWSASLRSRAYDPNYPNDAAAYYRFVSAGNVMINSYTSVPNTSMIYFRDNHFTDKNFSVRCKKLTN